MALQPRLRLPIRSSQGHVLHLDVHSLEDSKPLGYTSQSHLAPLLPISPALTPDPYLPPPIALESVFNSLPHAHLTILTPIHTLASNTTLPGRAHQFSWLPHRDLCRMATF